jgi:iron complex outermembrane receptor protein
MYCVALLALTATTMLTPRVVEAQGSDQFEIEEIIVTARRRSERLQDVPGSVTVLSASVIEGAGIRRPEGFIALTPGVTMVNAASVADTQVNIRGINGARDAETSFAYVLDGILHTNPAAINREYTNLQQVEIFKGPQGAIYGRSAAAGAIIVTTAKPGNESEFKGRLSFAEDNSMDGYLSWSGPLKEDAVYLNLSADYRESDGFYRNKFQNNAAIVDAFEAFNINGRLVWDASESLSIDTKFRYGEVDASSITFNSVFQLPVFAAGGFSTAYQDVNDFDFQFDANAVSDNDQEAIEFSSRFDYDTAGGSTLTGWVLYSDNDNNLMSDGTSAAFGFYNNVLPSSPGISPSCPETVLSMSYAANLLGPQFVGLLPIGVIFDDTGSFLGAYTPTTCDGLQEQVRSQEDLSFELRLASADDQKLRWMFGVYFADIEREVGVSLNADSGDTPIRGLLQVGGPNSTASLTHDRFDTQVTSVFGQIEYDMTDSTELAFALRYDNEDRDVSSLVPPEIRQDVIDLNFDTIFGNDPLNPALSDLINPTGLIPDKSASFSEVQPKVSLRWDATDTTSFFGSWGVGFKAGGFNNSGSQATVDIYINGFINGGNPSGIFFADDMGVPLPVITDDYKEETSSAFELGFKSAFQGGRLQLSGAAYYTEVTDMQFFEFFVGTFGLLRVVSNIDDVEITGVELDLSWHATENLRFYVAGNHNIDDVEITGVELDLSWHATENLRFYVAGNHTDSEIKANSSRPDTVGNPSPYTPDYTFNIGADVEFPLSNGLSIVARIDAQQVGETWFHTVQEGDRPTIFMPLFEDGFIIQGAGPGFGPWGTAEYSITRRDEFSTVNFRLGLQGEKWAITAFALNLTDEKYIEEAIPAPEFGGTFVHPNARRRSGIEVTFNF